MITEPLEKAEKYQAVPGQDPTAEAGAREETTPLSRFAKWGVRGRAADVPRAGGGGMSHERRMARCPAAATRAARHLSRARAFATAKRADDLARWDTRPRFGHLEPVPLLSSACRPTA
jgi:hypothetical protein